MPKLQNDVPTSLKNKKLFTIKHYGNSNETKLFCEVLTIP